MQHDRAGKTVILFPDVPQSVVPLILIIMSFGCYLVCAYTWLCWSAATRLNIYIEDGGAFVYFITTVRYRSVPEKPMLKILVSFQTFPNLVSFQTKIHQLSTQKNRSKDTLKPEMQRQWTHLLQYINARFAERQQKCMPPDPLARTESRDHVTNLRKGQPPQLLFFWFRRPCKMVKQITVASAWNVTSNSFYYFVSLLLALPHLLFTSGAHKKNHFSDFAIKAWIANNLQLNYQAANQFNM